MVTRVLPDLSLCVPVSDADADLAPFLEAVSATDDHLGREIILVCPREVVEQLNGWEERPEVKVLGCSGRFSPVRALNVAASVARGRYLAFWDYRLLPLADSLMGLVSFLDDHPDIALVAPKVMINGKVLPAARQLPSLVGLWFGRTGRVMPGWQEYGSGEADWLFGPPMVLNRHALAVNSLAWWLPVLWPLALAVGLARQGWHIHYRHDAQAEGHGLDVSAPSRWERALAGSVLVLNWWRRLRGY